MNQAHLEFCGGPVWHQMVEEMVMPECLTGVDLGDDVVEIGPGPGFTTDVLRSLAARVTAVEIDPELARSLQSRLADTNVDVIEADATSLDLPDDRFSGAVSLNMLHHVPTANEQDRIFSELARVLRSDGVLLASDANPRDDLDDFHKDDTYNPIAPDALEARLGAAGFTDLQIRMYDLGWICTARPAA
jgi:SAM-dependent methyltransferase